MILPCLFLGALTSSVALIVAVAAEAVAESSEPATSAVDAHPAPDCFLRRFQDLVRRVRLVPHLGAEPSMTFDTDLRPVF